MVSNVPKVDTSALLMANPFGGKLDKGAHLKMEQQQEEEEEEEEEEEQPDDEDEEE